MEQEKKNQRASSRFWTKALLLVVVLLIGGFICFAISANKLENQAGIVLDKKMTLATRMEQFNELLDHHLSSDRDGKSLLKIIPLEILAGFKQLILDKEEDLSLRKRVAEVLLWRDPDGEMENTIATLIHDKSQHLSLRGQALECCMSDPLLSSVILDRGEDQKLREIAIRRSNDIDLLRSLVKHWAGNSMYRAANRLCEIDKGWLAENVLLDLKRDGHLRIRVLTYCFKGNNFLLQIVFNNRFDNPVIRALALSSMSEFPDEFIATIMLDELEQPIVRATAIAISNADWVKTR